MAVAFLWAIVTFSDLSPGETMMRYPTGDKVVGASEREERMESLEKCILRKKTSFGFSLQEYKIQ